MKNARMEATESSDKYLLFACLCVLRSKQIELATARRGGCPVKDESVKAAGFVQQSASELALRF